MKDLNTKATTIKPLEENIGEKLYGLGLHNDFLDKMPKAKATKEKIDVGLHQNFKWWCTKENYQQCEKAALRMGENMCKTHI